MKTTVLTLAAVASVSWLAQSLPAAEQAQSSDLYVYASYFHCNERLVRDADDAVAALYKGELNEMIKEKTVSSWGYLVKKTGGEWSRAGYLTGTSVDEVLHAGDVLALKSDWRFEVRAFLAACSSSEDYIWHIVAGNDARGDRGKVALSTYYVCDQSHGVELDTLVKRDLAPKFDALVKAGKLTSWAWADQALGGKYQRLATMSAATQDAVLAAHEDLARNKGVVAVCGSHQDYIWEVHDQGHD